MFSEMVAGVNGSSDIEGISGMWHAGVWEGKNDSVILQIFKEVQNVWQWWI